MNRTSGETFSFWMKEAEGIAGTRTAGLSTEPLGAHSTADVCVIGAGISGLTAAYLLAREGLDVLVIEDGTIGSGETSRTTAHLSYALDDRFCVMEKVFGDDGVRLAAESHAAAIDLIENIVRQEKIECDFERVTGYLFAPEDEPRKILVRELASVKKAGLHAVHMLERAPIKSFDTGPCLQFPNLAQFHPMRYLLGLAAAARRYRVRIHTDTHARTIEGGAGVRIVTSRGFEITAHNAVVATNSPVNDRFTIHTKQAAYRTYVISALIPKGSMPKLLLWDTSDPYHYVRMQTLTQEEAKELGAEESQAYDLLIVGGEDHKTGQANDMRERYDRLESWARERFPMMTKVVNRWSGQVLETFDGLAFIGRNPGDENIYIVTGDSGMGMTHGTIAGILITDLIKKRENRWTEIYNPARKETRGAAIREFAKENANAAKCYAEWFLNEKDGEQEVPAPGEGMIKQDGLKKVAVYCDRSGVVHRFSAVCPHLGGKLQWNSGEKTWDCPIHGSRFTACGEVVNGPANVNMKSLESEKRRSA